MTMIVAFVKFAQSWAGWSFVIASSISWTITFVIVQTRAEVSEEEVYFLERAMCLADSKSSWTFQAILSFSKFIFQNSSSLKAFS